MKFLIMRIQEVLDGTHDGEGQIRAFFNETRFLKKVATVISNRKLNAFHEALVAGFGEHQISQRAGEKLEAELRAGALIPALAARLSFVMFHAITSRLLSRLRLSLFLPFSGRLLHRPKR